RRITLSVQFSNVSAKANSLIQTMKLNSPTVSVLSNKRIMISKYILWRFYRPMTATTQTAKIDMNIFEEQETELRRYSRSWTTVFNQAKGYKLWDTDGNEYIDFFGGAGTLNYGHNNDKMKQLLIEYIENDSITHSLDMASVARGEFLKRFNEVILKPRKLG